MTGRLFELESNDGPFHMAADDQLLALAVNGIPSVRFYTWSEPTLSLGYFQSYADRPESVRSLAVVRRSTGGGAIVHHHELTYSVGIPATLVGDEPWGCRMHHLIAEVLRRLDVHADSVVCGEEKKTDPYLCFHHHTAGDLAIGQRSAARDKVIGSAQRKQHGAILQHGSILLEASQFAPSLPGIHELTGRSLSPFKLAIAITSEFRRTVGWGLETSTWTKDDLKEIDRIRREKYSNTDWTQKR